MRVLCCAVLYCAGFQYNSPHIGMAVVIALTVANFLYLVRIQHQFESHLIIYFAAVLVVAASVAGIIYGEKWQGPPVTTTTTTTTTKTTLSCTGFYQASSGICISADPTSFTNQSCLQVSGNNGKFFLSTIVDGVTTPVPNPLTCAVADGIMETCYPPQSGSYTCKDA